MCYIDILLVLLVLLVFIYFIPYAYNYIKNKSKIYIRLKSYIVLENYYNSSYITDRIDGVDSNKKYIFKNHIYIFLNNDLDISQFHTYNYNLDLSSINKNDDNQFISYYTIYTPIGYYKKYFDIILNTNKFEDTDIKKIKKSYYDRCEPLIIQNISYDNCIFDFVDFIDSNYILYNEFINMFNDKDKNIIKVGAFGISGSGKTYFLRNIKKILFHNKNNTFIISQDLYKTIYHIINNKNIDHNNKLNKIKRYLYQNHCYDYKIIYINFDIPELETYIDDIFEIINNMKLLSFKLIILCESYNPKYTKYTKNLDIIYKGDYLNNDQIDKINIKINKKLNNLCHVNNLCQKTINDIISFIFKDYNI